jgi:RNA polymerase sigma factor (sigma-70 family)
VRLVRLGHEPAFEQIYDRHHRGILAFCRHMLGSRDEGEDAVQHTFIAAYRDLRGSDKPIHLKAWLYTIARNRCLSMLRARREQVSIDDVEPSTDGLAAEVQRRQDLKDMLVDLQRLPEDQRAALVLSELGALSHEEIAMSLDVRKEKVKALVFQARESLTSSRRARDTDCAEIQKQLAVLRGGSLRRTTLRRHVDQCPACAAYRAEVQRQRAALAIILPVAPSAGLKAGVLSAAVGAGAGGGAIAAGGGLIGTKFIVSAVIAGAGLGGGLMAIDELGSPPASAAEENGRQKADAPTKRSGSDRRAAAAAAPADGDAARVVGQLRARARDAAVQRTADRRGAPSRAAWAKSAPGAKTGPDPAVVLNVVADPVGALEEARKPKKARDGRRGGAGDGVGRTKPKKAKKPKISQGQGAQGKGNAYGRGREPAASGGKGNGGGTNGKPKPNRRARAAKPKARRVAPPAVPQAPAPAAAGPAKPRKQARGQVAKPESRGNGNKGADQPSGPTPNNDVNGAVGNAKDAIDGALPRATPEQGDDGKGKVRAVFAAVFGIA